MVVFVIGAPTFSKISFCEHFLVDVFPSFESERADQYSNGSIKCFTCFRCLCSLDKLLVMVVLVHSCKNVLVLCWRCERVCGMKLNEKEFSAI